MNPQDQPNPDSPAEPKPELEQVPMLGFKAEVEEEEEFDVPKPMEWLQGTPVPPFLSKTYELVEDRSLDRIISWGEKGKSFVVWDPVDFSRTVLPRNFKHNNFSSFVRQLNTYGFRKIDTDKWEFANGSFRRGERHLLKNIQRRKSPQSQQSGIFAGPSSETAKSGVEVEVERLRKERSIMMQEVVELQQQQRGSVQHMGEVNERLQSAEQRQKQMLSFLGKLFRNPEFISCLSQQKDRGLIGSSRTKRRFLGHQQLEGGHSASSVGGNISSVVPEVIPLPMEPPGGFPIQDAGSALGREGMFQIENISFDELAASEEMWRAQGLIETPEIFGEGTSMLGGEVPALKGESVMAPQLDMGPEYSVYFPEDLSAEKDFPEFPPPAIESMVSEEDMWNLGLESSAGMSSSTSELWGNVTSNDVPEFGSTGSFLDMWDMSSIQAAGGSGSDKWSTEQNPIGKLESHAGRSGDYSPQHRDP